ARRQTAGPPGGTAPPRPTARRRGPRTPPPCHAKGRPAWGSSRSSSATPAQESHGCDSPRSGINQRARTLAKNTSHLVVAQPALDQQDQDQRDVAQDESHNVGDGQPARPPSSSPFGPG